MGGHSERSEESVTLSSALTAGDFFLSRQEKVTKKKATPGFAPLLRRGSLRYSVGRAAAQLGATPLRQCSPTSPGQPALLSAAQGDPQGSSDQPPTVTLLSCASPFGDAEQRHCARGFGEDCLSPAGASSAAGRNAAAQGTAPQARRRQRGRLFFRTFLLATQKKVTRRQGGTRPSRFLATLGMTAHPPSGRNPTPRPATA